MQKVKRQTERRRGRLKKIMKAISEEEMFGLSRTMYPGVDKNKKIPPN